MSGVDVSADDFRKYYREISNVDAEMRKALRRRMTEAAKPVVEAVKAAELALPSSSGEVTNTRKKKGERLGLRASLANATKADFNATGRGAGIHIRVSRSKFEAVSGRPGSLPYLVEGRRKAPWRHPVFARGGATKGTWQGAWVTQKKTPFLGVTIEKYKASFKKEVTEVVTDAVRQCGIELK